ncbi:hypothetical protein PQX77_010973 [Marasmius sp. AFHP31]|nr:hypothetical protein PQX77_010973 [Marasmius sp. AFHP31]
MKDIRINPSGESQITLAQLVLEIDEFPQSSTQEQPTPVLSLSQGTSESRNTAVGTDGSTSSSTGALDPSSSSNNDTAKSTDHVTIIAGAVGGTLLAIILIIVVVYCWRRKRAREVVTQNRSLSSLSGPSYSSPEVDTSHDFPTPDLRLYFTHSIPTRQPDASGLFGNSEAAIIPKTRSNLSSWRRRAPSRPVIDGTRSLRTPPRLSFVRFNLLSNHRSPVANPTLVPYSQMHPAISQEERRIARRNPPGHLSTTSGSGSRRSLVPLERRREVDAGPVVDEDAPTGGDEGMSTLPPLYDRVFRSSVGVRQ